MTKPRIISGMAVLSLSLLSSSPILAQTTEYETYRMYNPFSHEHFYTQSLNEKEALYNLGWAYEGIAWNAPSQGQPVYRLYNPNTSEHHYTANYAERTNLLSLGWKNEDVAFYSDGQNRVPVYRLYNSRVAKAGSHHYTADFNEKEQLKKAGWKEEGIAWYGTQGARLLAKPDFKSSNTTSFASFDHTIRLDVPQYIAEATAWSGPAALQMVLAYFGIPVSQTQLANALQTNADGTSLENLVRVANQYGKKSYQATLLPAWTNHADQRFAFEASALADLKQGKPVILSINTRFAYKTPQDEIRQVVLYGAELDTLETPTAFYYLDPSLAAQDPIYQGRKTISATVLWQCMTNNPNPGYLW